MVQIIAGYGFALVCAGIVIAGDWLLKHAAVEGHSTFSPLTLMAVGLYALSAIAWFGAMRHISLAQAAVAYSMFSLLALCVIGAVFFGERLAVREIVGIGCAMVAVICMVRFA